MKTNTRKTNAAITCAVGAMLFGGTIGTAEAGVTGLQNDQFGGVSRTSLSADNYSSYSSAYVTGFQMNGPVLFSDPGLGGATCSQFTSDGFSLMADFLPGTDYVFNVKQYFTVAGGVNFVLSGTIGLNDYVYIQRLNADGSSTGHAQILPTDLGAFSLSGTLADTSAGGYYLFEYYLDRTADAAASSTLFNLSFSAVPAPGAVALLGFAGLAGRRRRGRR